MSNSLKFIPIDPHYAQTAHIDAKQYQTLYQQSLDDPQTFWAEQATQFLTWHKPWNTVLQGDFTHPENLRWFAGAELNACFNCLDRHLEKRGEQIAIIWEGDELQQSKTLTYAQLHTEVCRFANVLKSLRVKKGDRVCIYLPMVPEVAIAMLACARIGAIHSVVFAGFSADSLKNRIVDADCRVVITADEGIRGSKHIPLKVNIDTALRNCPNVEHVIVLQHSGRKIPWSNMRDIWYHDAMAQAAKGCPFVEMAADDPLFILYTSGSTGKPKGILHGTAGYLLYAAMTHKYIFNYHDGDIYWCTADVGWITGHSYSIYGPLLNGATTLLFAGVPNYPTPARFWQVIDKHHVNIFYTAPTALRALRREGDDYVNTSHRNSLKLLGTVGEPINPDVWLWYYQVVGNNRCPIVDTWWQTETGGILISAIPGAMELKPGSATLPFFGIAPAIVNDEGKPVPAGTPGNLVITQPWPGMMQTIYGNPQRFINGYFQRFPGKYAAEDAAYCDNDGYYWIIGRVDDIIKVSGHRLSTAEIESALVSHPAVSEAAAVAIPDDIKGEGIYVYACLKAGFTSNEELKEELINQVRTIIGHIATPETIQWTAALPKTRSGKIMRRLLRKIASNELDELGDTSTLAEPEVVERLIQERNL